LLFHSLRNASNSLALVTIHSDTPQLHTHTQVEA
jgi:hypothetical protein